MRRTATVAALAALGCALAAGTVAAQATRPASTNPDRPRTSPPADRIRQPVDTHDPAFHTMEIFNGPTRTVSYSSPRANRAEQDALNNLSRAESQVALADRLLSLRQQYAADESRLEARRSNVQETFYGFSTTVASGYPVMAYPGNVGLVGYPNSTVPFNTQFAFPGFGFNYGSPYLGADFPLAAGSAVVTTAGTAVNGVGDEGAIKTEMARIMAKQATPEYVAQVTKSYDTALAQAAGFESLRAGLSLPDRGVVPVAGTDEANPVRVKVMTKGGQTIEGTLVREDDEWVVIRNNAGTTDLARSEVKSIERTRAKKSAPMTPVPSNR